MPGPAVAAIATGLGSSLISGISANKAADAQAGAADDATRLQADMFNRVDDLSADVLKAQRTTTIKNKRANIADADQTQAQQLGIAGILAGLGMEGAQATRNANVDELSGREKVSVSNIARTRDKNLSSFHSARDKNMRTLENARVKSLDPFKPQVELGNNALAAYGSNLGIGKAPAGYSLEMTPGAQFLTRKMNEGVQGSAAAQGGLLSGATLEALQKEAAGIAATDRDNQQSQLFNLGQLGQSAAGTMANIRQHYAGATTGERSRYADAATGERSAATQGINALRSAYGDAIVGQNDQLFQRLYGVGSDWANMSTGALDAGVNRRTGARDFETGALGTARTNRTAVLGDAGQSYANNAGAAMIRGGQAQAAGYMGTANALTDGINTGFGTYGAMGGKLPWMQQLANPNTTNLPSPVYTNPQALY